MKTYWLIECPDYDALFGRSHIAWLGLQSRGTPTESVHYHDVWVADVHKAVRFCTKESAETVLSMLSLSPGNLIATEHMDAAPEPSVAAEVRGTSECPICGVDVPHGHGPQDVENWLHAQAMTYGYDFDLIRFEPKVSNLSDFVTEWRKKPYWGYSGILLHSALDALEALLKREAPAAHPGIVPGWVGYRRQ